MAYEGLGRRYEIVLNVLIHFSEQIAPFTLIMASGSYMLGTNELLD